MIVNTDSRFNLLPTKGGVFSTLDTVRFLSRGDQYYKFLKIRINYSKRYNANISGTQNYFFFWRLYNKIFNFFIEDRYVGKGQRDGF